MDHVSNDIFCQMFLRSFSKTCSIVNRCNKHHFVNIFFQSKMPFYAVASGKRPGVYSTWGECESQVKGFKGAKYKKFNTNEEALCFVTGVPASAISGNTIAPLNGNTTASYSGNATNSFNRNRTASFSTNTIQKDVEKTKKIKQNKKSDSDVEYVDDLHEEMMKKMDEIEKDITAIKENALNKTVPKKTGEKNAVKSSKRVIETSPKPLKRPADSVAQNESKKLKTMNISKDGMNYTFDTDEYGYVIVYTDGSCIKNGYYNAKAGLGVYFGENHPLNVSEPVSGRPTNNCGEIQAATKAIRVVHSLGIQKLNIKTDSMFVINSMTKWIAGWKRKGWKLANGKNVKNQVDFKDLDEAQELMYIRWEYVNAHKGILGNERADQLAKLGAAQYISKSRKKKRNNEFDSDYSDYDDYLDDYY